MNTAILDLNAVLPDDARDCQSCQQRLGKLLKRETGIYEVQIHPTTWQAEIEYDPQLTTADDVDRFFRQVAEKFQAETYVHETIPIEGMTCDDCAAQLQRSVSRLDGVSSVSVSFAGARMQIEYAAGSVQPEQIAQRVKAAGYRVSEPESGATTERQAALNFLRRTENMVAIAGAFLVLAGLTLQVTGAPSISHMAAYGLAVLVAGPPIARKALSGLWHSRQLDINMLMTIAVLGALGIGEWLEAATVVVLFSFGEALEGYSMDRARRSIRSLMSLTPDEALVRRNGVEQTLPVDEIVAGDTVIVRPGGRVPVDGEVAGGVSLVDQAPITGESVPVEKIEGDRVFSGSINGANPLEIRASRKASDSTIARIIHMVEDAQARRAPSQRFVDVFARYYTPAVVAGAIMVALLPPLLAGGGWYDWFYRALVLLVVACPCALVISTPVSIVSAISSSAKRGVLIKGGAYLEALGSLRALAFDKTGTLTLGRPDVSVIQPFGSWSEDDVLEIAAAAERYSEHPIGNAITRAATLRDIDFHSRHVEASSSTTGLGVNAHVDNRDVQVGSRRMIDGVTGLDEIDGDLHRLEREGLTPVIVAVDGALAGIFGLRDELRPEAASAIAALRKAGIQRTIMLTGDRREVAETIARDAGIDQVEAELLPDQKVEAIEQLLREHQRVGMVGDGVNDAPALARSTVGIAMGAAGTDTALETADVALMGDELGKVSDTIRLSKRTRKIIAQNIGLALGIKVLVLGLAVFGLATLWQAILADVGASLVVILNGMRLLRQPSYGDTPPAGREIEDSAPLATQM